jgi:NtrC-family two-component system response regulator AlgB
VIFGSGEDVEIDVLPPAGAAAPTPALGGNVTLTELGDEHIRRVLAKTARYEDAAAILGIDLATLYRRRRKWDHHSA